ncbi:MAG TPA: hypothetical protein VHU44_02255 [Acidobacteriaceae bacterium]|jgi:hypothetical protein|nr:hypothetical protein [Acidobacteriaceae bacterium]
MQQSFDWSWVEAQVGDTVALWHSCANRQPRPGRTYNRKDQRRREKAYDQALAEVEREGRTKPVTAADRRESQARTTSSFGRFSAEALDLESGANRLLTDDFLPVATGLARWARRFDPSLSKEDIVQACRNAWTACGLQPLFGEHIELTPSILGYSLLYPYTDNYLDQPVITANDKHHFSDRFRQRLSGEPIRAINQHESALWELVSLIEGQYPRDLYPGVYDCLLAIHRAQEDSIAQLSPGREFSAVDLLHLSCAKGGSSVLTDACLARGSLTEQESRFAFHWGVLLQLGDDLQDVQEDLHRGSATLFSRAAAFGIPMDNLTNQLLSFSDCIANEMDELPNGSRMLKTLLRTSWRSLIVNASAESSRFFTRKYLTEIEQSSPFRFGFLRGRRKRLTRRRGLYESLFDTFLEEPEDSAALPLPSRQLSEICCD